MANGSGPLWTVTAQKQAMGLDSSDRYVQGVEVTFRTMSGDSGTVFLPHTGYTVEAARDAINARAAVMESVRGLQG